MLYIFFQEFPAQKDQNGGGNNGVKEKNIIFVHVQCIIHVLHFFFYSQTLTFVSSSLTNQQIFL